MPRKPKYGHNLWPQENARSAAKNTRSWKPTYNIAKSKRSGRYSFDYYDRNGDRVRRTLNTSNYRIAMKRRKAWMDMDKVVYQLVDALEAGRKLNKGLLAELNFSEHHQQLFAAESAKIKKK